MRPAAARLSNSLVLAACLLAAAGCAPEPPVPAADSRAESARDDRPPRPLDIPADAPLVAFLGDSISAGLHLPEHAAFPAVLQRRLFAAGAPFRLLNAGVSGGTTSGGTARLDWLLARDPDVVVVELGVNDGFRGTSLDTVERNLREIVRRSRAAGARVLLLGMRLPPNYGPEYVAAFDSVYPRIAEEMDVPFVPYFMEGVAGRTELNLPDGIHPTRKGHELLAETVQPALAGLLRTTLSAPR